MASPFVLIGSTEQIRDFICGPQQHNEHCKGYRWFLYVRDSEARWEAVKAELKRMHAARREMEDV